MFKIGDKVKGKISGKILTVKEVKGNHIKVNKTWRHENKFSLIKSKGIQRYHFKDVEPDIRRLCNDAVEDGAKAWICYDNNIAKCGVTTELGDLNVFHKQYVGCYCVYWIHKSRIGKVIEEIKKNLKYMDKPKKTNYKVIQFIS